MPRLLPFSVPGVGFLLISRKIFQNLPAPGIRMPLVTAHQRFLISISVKLYSEKLFIHAKG